MFIKYRQAYEEKMTKHVQFIENVMATEHKSFIKQQTMVQHLT